MRMALPHFFASPSSSSSIVTPAVAAWERAGLQVRLCVDPDEPLLIERYLDLERVLQRRETGSCDDSRWDQRWDWAWRSACLLMETASDAALPMHWRWLCLDHVHRPLHTLSTLADSEVRRRLFAGLSWQLANLRIGPDDRFCPGCEAPSNGYSDDSTPEQE